MKVLNHLSYSFCFIARFDKDIFFVEPDPRYKIQSLQLILIFLLNSDIDLIDLIIITGIKMFYTFRFHIKIMSCFIKTIIRC